MSSDLPKIVKEYLYEQIENKIKADVSAFEVITALMQGIVQFVYGFFDDVCLLSNNNPEYSLKFVQQSMIEKQVSLFVDYDTKMCSYESECEEELSSEFNSKFARLCLGSGVDIILNFDKEAEMIRSLKQDIPDNSGVQIVSFVDMLKLIHHLYVTVLRKNIVKPDIFLHRVMQDVFNNYQHTNTTSEEPEVGSKKRKLPVSTDLTDSFPPLPVDLFDSFAASEPTGLVPTYHAKKCMNDFIHLLFHKCILERIANTSIGRPYSRNRGILTTGTDVLKILSGDPIIKTMCNGIKIKYHTSEYHFHSEVQW